MIYLDWNATAPLHPVAREAILEAMAEVGNASSVHQSGRAARHRIEDGRSAIASLVGIGYRTSPEMPAVVFTASGTEANHLAVQGWSRVAVSSIEHPSLIRARDDSVQLEVQSDGVIDLEALETLCSLWQGEPFLVSVMLANNETGVIQPIAEIAERVHASGGILHSDASQAVGRIPIDMEALGLDLLTLSGHKLGAGFGAAALVRRGDVPITPLFYGGGQEYGLRSGTENLPAIAGLAAMARIAEKLVATAPKIARLRDKIAATAESIHPETVVIGAGMPRLPNTLCLALVGIVNTTQIMAFDLSGIAISAGSACASGTIKPSPVLEAMRMPPEVLNSAVRLSLGPTTEEEVVPRVAAVWKQLSNSVGR